MHRSEKRILIAERNRHVRDFIRRELASRDYLVRGACNSDEVFAMLGSPQPPDLIILAMDTPNTGSAGLLERIAADHPRTPVILYVYREETADKAVTQLAAGIVEKNGDPARLTDMVERLLSGRAPSDHNRHREG